MKALFPLLVLAGCAAPAPPPDDRDAWRAEKDARIAALETALANEKGFSQKVREQLALADQEVVTTTARIVGLEQNLKKQTDLVQRWADRVNVLDVENSSKAIRINDLQKQLDFAHTFLVKVEADLQGFVKRLEAQSQQLQDREKEAEKLRARVAELEKK